ncbi:hypothetical protein HX824_25985 [Pseudomonas sp. D4002]|uniref:hypothetical protein n=1 Tax=Pseudomonas sp. D4002 TaxID=2738817 RepID=UPI00159F92A2|nr:hypothetical protein [Pseudomonas sp. D4002]NWB24081.1 hypothetical protein [Pseudomonas sp. D4002]
MTTQTMQLFHPRIYDLKLKENFGIYFDEDYKFTHQLELHILDYARLRKMPIGYLAYSCRASKRPFTRRWIAPLSLRISRLEPLRLLACSLSYKSAYELAASGIIEIYSMFAGFIQFCDINECENVLDSPENYHRALVKYSYKLDFEVAATGRGNRANRKLVVVMSVGYEIFPDASLNFRIGVKFPGYSKDEQENTRVPDEEKLFPLYRVVDAIFKEVLNFLTGSRKEPKVVEKHQERYWFIPTYYPLISETAIFENQKKNSRGVILTVIRTHALKLIEDSAGRMNRSEAIAIVVERLLSGESLRNEDVTNRSEFLGLPLTFADLDLHRLAILAHDCFLFIFVLNTNANLSVAANILWDDALSVEVEVQRLRSIKRRAKNKAVDVVFGVRFLKRLRDYFELRQFLPCVEGFKYLFGTFDPNGTPLQVGDNPAGKLLKTLRRVVNPTLQGVGYRELRVYHHHSKSAEHGLSIAAYSAQHTEATAIQSYTAGNEDVVISEGVMYFSGLGKAVEEHLDTQAGGCTGDLINAAQINSRAGVIPDCKNFIGCLFCEHYILHLDLIDAAKLISMEYLIAQLEAIQQDSFEFEMIYGPTLARITWLLGMLQRSNDVLMLEVPKLRNAVYRDEALTHYWQAKLNVLVEIGAL